MAKSKPLKPINEKAPANVTRMRNRAMGADASSELKLAQADRCARGNRPGDMQTQQLIDSIVGKRASRRSSNS
jgi:hypothetical protein